MNLYIKAIGFEQVDSDFEEQMIHAGILDSLEKGLVIKNNELNRGAVIVRISESTGLYIYGRFKDKELIKVITGIRRCGKSTLLELFQAYLIENGVEENRIISINLEDLEYNFITDYMSLYKYINAKLEDKRKYYIFIDEVQKIDEFQKAVDSLYIKKNVDLYITGSNANLLSRELATFLSGRYIEVKMLPLSFKEYKEAYKDLSNEDLYQKYI